MTDHLVLMAEGQEIFLEAMKRGYAVDVPRYLDQDLPGSKRVPFIRGRWRLMDTWVTGENGYSAGWTVLFHNDRAVWNMHYQGRYEKRAIPGLKAALRENYERKIFWGGRGPALTEVVVAGNSFVYENAPAISERGGFVRAAFDWFEGRETVGIVDKNNAITPVIPLGFHEYRGMWIG